VVVLLVLALSASSPGRRAVADVFGVPSSVSVGVTGHASSVTSTEATLNGTLEQVSPGSRWFVMYGASSAYDHRTAPAAAGSSCATECAISVGVYGLSPSSTYHFALCTATIAGSTTCGLDRSFTTSRCTLSMWPPGRGADGALAAVERADSLRPGQTLCLHGGTYARRVQPSGRPYTISSSGTHSAPITLTAYPGEYPRLVGWLVIDGSYVKVSHLQIDGTNSGYVATTRSLCPAGSYARLRTQPLFLSGAHDVLEDDDYYQSAEMGGSNRRAGNGILVTGDWTVIRQNRIHDMGMCKFYDHAIYLEAGSNTQIYRNWMWNVPHGWGIHLYPNAVNANVRANVIDTAGSGVTIANGCPDTGNGRVPAGNNVANNVVSHATGLSGAALVPGVALSVCWGRRSRPPSGSCYSAVPWNCFAMNLWWPADGVDPPYHAGARTLPGVDVQTLPTITADPQYVDAAHHDYAVRPTSPAATWGLWDGQY